MTRRLLGALLGGLLLCACGATASDQSTTAGGEAAATQTGAPPVAPPVGILDLVPARSTAAGFVDVALARQTSQSEMLLELVRGLGSTGWEQALGIDLATEVDAIAVYIFDESQQQMRGRLGEGGLYVDGVLVELLAGSPHARGECDRTLLAQATPEAVAGLGEGTVVTRCGRLIAMTCQDCAPVAPQSGSGAAEALERLRRPPAGDGLLFASVFGRSVFGQAQCDGGAIQLGEWQSVTLSREQGLVARGRFHAAETADVPRLESCVRDGLAALGSSGLLAPLGIDRVLASAVVERDAHESKDVIAILQLSDAEARLFLLLVQAATAPASP